MKLYVDHLELYLPRNQLYAMNSIGEIRVWKIDELSLEHEFKIPNASGICAAPGGKTGIFAFSTKDKKLFIIDAEQGKTGPALGLPFSPSAMLVFPYPQWDYINPNQPDTPLFLFSRSEKSDKGPIVICTVQKNAAQITILKEVAVEGVSKSEIVVSMKLGNLAFGSKQPGSEQPPLLALVV